jgi:hypothetical protein
MVDALSINDTSVLLMRCMSSREKEEAKTERTCRDTSSVKRDRALRVGPHSLPPRA